MCVNFKVVIQGMNWDLYRTEKLDGPKSTLVVLSEKIADDNVMWELYIGSIDDERRAKYFEKYLSSSIINEWEYYKPDQVSYRSVTDLDKRIYKAVVKDRGFA